MVKNGEFALLALTLLTGEHVQIFPGAEKIQGGICSAAGRAKGRFPGSAARGQRWKR
jgi:hypothetical protein